MVAVAVAGPPAVRGEAPPRRVRPAGFGRDRRPFRRRRLVALAALTVTLVGAWYMVRATLGWIGGGPLTAADQPGGMRAAAQRVWVVRPGDTLWGIAAGTGARGDLRPLVDRLSDETGGRPLHPGERVALPGR